MDLRRVLVIDDDRAIREAMAELLEGEGFTTLTAANGKFALEILEGTPDLTALPRVIVLDLMMPLMDGWTFRKKQLQQSRFCDIPVVVISAGAHRATIDDGISAFVPKPFAPSDLLRCIETLCSGVGG